MADLDRLFNIIQKEKGRLDILFVNAGLGEAAQMGSITEEFFDKIFNLNVKGLLFTVQKSLPIFANGGSIILNASIATIQGIPTNSVYSASKAAVRSFARCWTVDLKERHIRVNVVSPGIIGTSSIIQATSNEQGKAIISAIVAATPLNRLGTPDEVAKTVVFLASDDSSYITGIELFVDGGAAQI
jgi:NAD(P)-dependent dehydrogenase (short-subunit alcohol dehydrogenase family)